MDEELKQKKKITTGPIVFILGTSCTGKTTLIRKITEKKSSLKWHESGWDEGLRKILDKKEETYRQILERDVDCKQKFNKLVGCLRENRFEENPETKIFSSIANGVLEISFKDKDPLKLLLNVSDPEIDEFIKQISKDKNSLYTKEFIEDLHLLVYENHLKFKELTTEKYILNKIFDDAIENSKKGEATLLDFIFTHSTIEENLPKRFTDYLEEKNLDCPVCTVIVHCNMPELVKHIKLRKLPKVKASPSERWRFAALHYTGAFIVNDEGKVGKFKKQYLIDCFEEFMEFENNEIKNKWLQEAFKEIGIPEESTNDKVFNLGVKSVLKYDLVCQSYSNELLEQNAKSVKDKGLKLYEEYEKKKQKQIKSFINLERGVELKI